MPTLVSQSVEAQIMRARNLELQLRGLPIPPEPSPCEDCRHRARCAARLEACEAFRMFGLFGNTARCAIAPRQPSAAIYAAIFG